MVPAQDIRIGSVKKIPKEFMIEIRTDGKDYAQRTVV
jgi:hypothetical protein